jgi:hypothetical protein
LVVDPVGNAGEIRRFNRYVIAGPSPHDCAVFVGAIGDDGYGRFWLGRPGGPKVVRAQRFAVAAVHGVMPAGMVAMHECDNPLCVRVGPRHVVIGTQSDNLTDMGRKHRGGGSGWARGASGLDRQARRARAHAVRAALVDGWDRTAVSEALGAGMPGQETLFALGG